VKLHISTKFQIHYPSALRCSAFPFLSFKIGDACVRDSDNGFFYLALTFIIHCAL